MLRHRYLICMRLHTKLKEDVSGRVFITIEDNDTLVVHITGTRGLKFTYEYKGISYEMVDNDLDYDKVTRIILNKYKEFIMGTFFRR